MPSQGPPRPRHAQESPGVTVEGRGRVNCPFYFKVGACRHGDRCSRQHNKPLFSQTVLLAHMYQAPASVTSQQGPTAMSTAGDDKAAQEHFDDFYEEVRPRPGAAPAL